MDGTGNNLGEWECRKAYNNDYWIAIMDCKTTRGDMCSLATELGSERNSRREWGTTSPLPPPGPDQMFQVYERFRHMKPEGFDGSTDLIVTEEWLNSV